MTMTQAEQIQYLANIYYLAYADENFEVVEDDMVIEIAKEIDAGYLETRKALDMAAENEFMIKFPHRYSEKIRAIEDMMLVAICDNKLARAEKKIIMTYAKQLGISQTQFDVIKTQAKDRLKNFKK